MEAVILKPNNISVRNFETVFKEPNYAIRLRKHEPEFVVAADCGAHFGGALTIPIYFPRLGLQFRKKRCERILISMYQPFQVTSREFAYPRTWLPETGERSYVAQILLVSDVRKKS